MTGMLGHPHIATVFGEKFDGDNSFLLLHIHSMQSTS
jgi:hypothetical protein